MDELMTILIKLESCDEGNENMLQVIAQGESPSWEVGQIHTFDAKPGNWRVVSVAPYASR